MYITTIVLYNFRKKANAAMAMSKATGFKHSYCFMKLPNHNYLTQVHPDAMHTVKDCIERVFFLLTGKVNLDDIKSCETSMGTFYINSYCAGHKRRRGKSLAATARAHPYVLTSDELKLADIRSRSIVMPNNDFTPGLIFLRTSTLKSHDWTGTSAQDSVYIFGCCSEIISRKCCLV